ncbi:MAG: ORF6C domain-containing protein [Clostridium sp.]|nr:ORF6C domain-containing protein [Clostridium sp.]
MENIIIRSNKAEIFTSDEFGQVKTLLNDDGSISINAEDAAVGLGWYEEKYGRKYVRWRTFNSYVKSFGFSEEVQKDDYIPESLFYLLAMKATNSASQDFQRWIAVEVIPEIRSSGRYSGNNGNNNDDGNGSRNGGSGGNGSRSGNSGTSRSSENYSTNYNTTNASSYAGNSDNVSSDITDIVAQSSLSPELQAIFCIDKRTTEIKDRITKIENNTTIDYSQQEEIRSLVNKKVIEALGGKGTPAYKELSKRVYCSIWNDYKRRLNVNSYRNTSVKNYDYARDMLESWTPSREVELMITGANVSREPNL